MPAITRPAQNAFVESFNARLRNEFLAVEKSLDGSYEKWPSVVASPLTEPFPVLNGPAGVAISPYPFSPRRSPGIPSTSIHTVAGRYRGFT